MNQNWTSSLAQGLDLPLSKLCFALMLQVKLPVVDRIHHLSNKFAVGVENKATGNTKLNDSPALGWS